MKRRNKITFKKSKSPRSEKCGTEHILNDNTKFDTIETYKLIRTNIMFSMPKTERGKVIAVTSSSPGEGKTTTSINLAITFAQMGAKVLLMDCDLRKSRTHRYLQIEKKDGVSNVLCGFTEFDRAVKKNVRENLDCLTSGEIPPNPAELLGTEEFEKLIDEVSEKYDYVFIDTPPMTVVTDAAIVMKHSIGVVVVVKQNVTTFDILDLTMASISKAETNILGVIMVGSENKAKRYGYYKNGKYGYKYRSSKYDYKYGDDDDEEM